MKVMTAPRCVLFVPGNRPDRFDKALASGVDRVCIDLEDAVGLDAKDRARDATIERLAAGADRRLGLRINPPDSPAGQRDLEALAGIKDMPAFIMVPKFENSLQLELITDVLRADYPPLIPLVETTRGLLEMDYELNMNLRIGAVMFGGYDYSVDAGCDFAWEPLLYARSRLVTIARAHGIDAIDVPFIDIKDPTGLERETRACRSLGFSAKAAIHPAQVAVIQQAFLPTPEQLQHARAVVDAAEASAGDAVQLDGRLIDAPVIDAARRTLALAADTE